LGEIELNTHFKIIIPLYNVEKWVRACIRSIKRQDYENYQCIIIDDMSTDESAKIIREELEGCENFIFVKNEVKKYALRNIYEAIELSNPSEEDVIVTVDGDDWLANNEVLKKLNGVYKKEKCLLTYGSYAEYPSGKKGKFSKQIPSSITKEGSHRENPWMSSHLRTFKHKLWNKIEREDLLDPNGNFYEMSGDIAHIFPMLEMAGPRAKYIDDILYIYNVSNPINDHKVDHKKQLYLESLIRNSPLYNLWEEE
tara:strand:- start:5598 stop:6359 length:762 start_codon:yes stop_codon:yes gene_type:complete